MIDAGANAGVNAGAGAGVNAGAGAGAGAGPSPGPGSASPSTSRPSSLSSASVSFSSPRRPAWWKIRLFRGMANDVRRRAPYYVSDWLDAWDYRVVPATVYMYFANILPALAFSLDMFTKTDMHYGVNEVLLSSVLGAVVFSVLACQPLVIVGVTGPITVFNYTVYDIVASRGTNYLAFMCWIGLWSLVFHWVLAATNACNGLRYVTRFPCDVFGFYVAFIYLQKGIQVLTRLGDGLPFYLSIFVGLAFFVVAYLCGVIGRSRLFTHPVRVFFKDYGTPLSVVFFSGFVHIGRMRGVPLARLQTGLAFEPTAAGRGWFVDFWRVSVGDVFLAIPFAVLLTILFYFDHNVSSLIAQGTEFPLKKPAGFHWDLFLLGLTTGVAGLLGLPFPNGLIPQAPFHTESLCVTEMVRDDGEKTSGTIHDNDNDSNSNSNKNNNTTTTTDDDAGAHKGHPAVHARVTHVVEQRVSNLAQGLLTLGTMTGPLLVVLHLIPQAVLAGLFFVMGVQALEGNGLTLKLLYLLEDTALVPRSHPLRQMPPRSDGDRRLLFFFRYNDAAVWLFVVIALVGFGATFALTQTIAAVGFPVIILLLIPARAWLLPRVFTPQELAVLDAPTASPFTMESVGGNYGSDDGPGRSTSGGGGGGDVIEADQNPSGSGASGVEDGDGGINKLRKEGRSGDDLAELGASRPHRGSRSSACAYEDTGAAPVVIEMQPQVVRTGMHNRRGQSSGTGSGGGSGGSSNSRR
ncbi:anion exchange protein 4 [Niveomyces insectorum RCEF 264]|uniref:Anion exchange protein 4 n=1 Tax=Niveomyces insectorum RCEF 264 TaxID=1081102 RepID=A0A168AHU0_9HYPO|nr:anion exchange protein 4 [Niveomyces insectorum RCEF 264]